MSRVEILEDNHPVDIMLRVNICTGGTVGCDTS